jgi:sugar lactone lactonase YvrE
MSRTVTTLLTGLAFGEGPRWRAGRLWISDMHAHEVLTVGLDGARTTVCEVANRPSGLGWLPDGRMLVVSMTDRRVLRREPDGQLVEHADLHGIATWDCNDMVVDGRGNAYVGNFGFDLHGRAAPVPAAIALVRPDGSAARAAEGLMFPNGSVVTADGATLIVGESAGRKLTAFAIAPDGSLGRGRTWADLGEGVPDGICLDAESAIWYADPRANRCVRVAEGGRVLETIGTDGGCYACMLGGPMGKTLFMLVAPTSDPAQAAAGRGASVVMCDVDAPRAGWP